MSFTKIEKDFTFKVIVFGDANVGKTTLTHRLEFNTFKTNMKKTIGVQFLSKSLFVNNISITLQVWDFSGEKRFKAFFPMWLSGARGGIFMYDITNYKSLDHMGDWLNIVYQRFNPEVFPIVLVGGKSDLISQRQVFKETGREMARTNKLKFIECSSKTGDNVLQIFQELTEKIYSLSNGKGLKRKL